MACSLLPLPVSLLFLTAVEPPYSFRTSTSARPPWRRMLPSCWLFWASGISTALGVRPTPCCPMTSTCTVLLPTSSRYRLPGHPWKGLVAGSRVSPCTGFTAHLAYKSVPPMSSAGMHHCERCPGQTRPGLVVGTYVSSSLALTCCCSG